MTANNPIVTVTGRIDALNAAPLDVQLNALAAQGQSHITIDLRQVSYLSSSGLRVLLLAHRRQQAMGGSLGVLGVPDRVMRVLRLAGFDRILNFQSDAPHHPTESPPSAG